MIDSNSCKNLINLDSLYLSKSSNRTFNYVFSDDLPSGDYYLSFNKISNISTINIGVMYNTTTIQTLSLTSSQKITINDTFNKFYFYIANSSDENSYFTFNNIMLNSGSVALPYCKYGSNSTGSDLTSSDVSSGGGAASSFISNFKFDDRRSISSIVSLPLEFYRSWLSIDNYCSDYSFNIDFLGYSNIVSLPSGCILWDKVDSSTESIYYVFIFGFFGGLILLDIYNFINKVRDPEDKKEIILNL